MRWRHLSIRIELLEAMFPPSQADHRVQMNALSGINQSIKPGSDPGIFTGMTELETWGDLALVANPVLHLVINAHLLAQNMGPFPAVPAGGEPRHPCSPALDLPLQSINQLINRSINQSINQSHP